MNVNPQKRIAADILKCGVNRIYIHPEYVYDVEMAITRDDIRNLIKSHIIQKRDIIGISRGRTNAARLKKKKGRSRGIGKRKGKKSARQPSKSIWVPKIRALRRELKKYRDSNKIEVSTYRNLYMKAKGNHFDSVATLKRYMNEHELWRN